MSHRCIVQQVVGDFTDFQAFIISHVGDVYFGVYDDTTTSKNQT